jgi:hypothetical protein
MKGLRLLLPLPFGVSLVWNRYFESASAATPTLSVLPQGFELVAADEVPADAFEVPLRQALEEKSQEEPKNDNSPRL